MGASPPTPPRGSRLLNAPPELVDLARQHLGAEHSVYFAPSIPPDKEANVRVVHSGLLPPSEPILVLHDATLFGSADNGFVVTPDRVCWKNLLEQPHQVPWGELDPRSVVAEANRVGVAGGRIDASGELIPGLVGLLLAMAARYVSADAGPYRSSAGDERKATRLAALARRHLGEVEHVHYHPAIPILKLRNVRSVHAPHLGLEDPVVLYDDTVFGSARDGFVVTPRRLCWKNVVDAAATVEWPQIAPETITASGNLVHMMGWTIQLTVHAHLAPGVAALFATIAAEARGDRRP